jgi:manganese/zinc/iron transport system substrate-binding protein
MLSDLVREIGGDHVTVHTLMGPGTDPHLYKALPSDRESLKSSDLIFYCGHHLEGKLADDLHAFGRRTRTIAACEHPSVARDRLLLASDQPDGAVDPHLWFDVALWRDVALGVEQSLAEFDPSNAAAYRTRVAALAQRLTQLDTEVRARVQQIAAERRVLVTAHDAFRYFGRAYQVEVVGIQGISTEDEAGIRKINDLVETIVRRGVRAVFVESTISEQNVRSLMEGCAARGHPLKLGGMLYSDAMGAAGSPAATYAGMVRHNVDTICEALK